MLVYAVTFAAAAVAAVLVTPIVARGARAMRIVDRPGTRKIHSSAVPTVGGLAVVVSALAVIVAVMRLHAPTGEAFAAVRTGMLALLATGAFIFVVGFIDDSVRVAARTKLLAQALAAVAVCAAGLRIEHLPIPGVATLHLGWLSWPVTVLWIVGITNTVNLIDGLDGLAAGIAAIASGVIAAFAVHTGQPAVAVVMLALMGSLAGFLVFNFHPARIFLGDCGSMFLGFSLATAAVMSASRADPFVALAMPALALGLPIFDTMFSMIRRVLERRSMFAPDQNHLHHRLIRMGLHHRHAVIVMYAVTLLAAGLGTFMLATGGAWRLAVLLGALVPVLAIFHVVGAARLREAFAAFRRNRALAREARERKHHFEEMELRLRRVDSFERWWKVVRRAARKMGFARVTIEYEGADGAARRLVWHLPGRERDPGHVVFSAAAALGARGGSALRVTADVPLNGSLESVGRRLTLFGRLLDEHAPTLLPGWPMPERPEHAEVTGEAGQWVPEPAKGPAVSPDDVRAEVT